MNQTLGTFFFIYGIIFVLACMLATSVSICAYLVSRRKVNLAVAAFFFFDMLESSLIFLDEYLGNKVHVEMAVMDFPMTHPQLKLILSLGLMASVWLLALGAADRLGRHTFVGTFSVTAMLEIGSLCIPDNNLKQLAFYSVRSLGMLVAIIWLLVMARRTEDRGLKSYLDGLAPKLKVLALLSVCVIVEDAHHLLPPFSSMALLPESPFFNGVDWLYFMAGRNISENVLTLYAGYHAIISAAEVLSMRFDEPPTADNSVAQQHADMRFGRFCEARGISVREADVLRCMLEGKNNRVIADELFISQGTVKAHVHAIYRKCAVNDRTSLLQLFWSD